MGVVDLKTAERPKRRKCIQDARYHNERSTCLQKGSILYYVCSNKCKKIPETEIESHKNGYYHVQLKNNGTMAQYQTIIDESVFLQIIYMYYNGGEKMLIDLDASDF